LVGRRHWWLDLRGENCPSLLHFIKINPQEEFTICFAYASKEILIALFDASIAEAIIKKREEKKKSSLKEKELRELLSSFFFSKLLFKRSCFATPFFP
jgi:hypothetical protein